LEGFAAWAGGGREVKEMRFSGSLGLFVSLQGSGLGLTVRYSAGGLGSCLLCSRDDSFDPLSLSLPVVFFFHRIPVPDLVFLRRGGGRRWGSSTLGEAAIELTLEPCACTVCRPPPRRSIGLAVEGAGL